MHAGPNVRRPQMARMLRWDYALVCCVMTVLVVLFFVLIGVRPQFHSHHTTPHEEEEEEEEAAAKSSRNFDGGDDHRANVYYQRREEGGGDERAEKTITTAQKHELALRALDVRTAALSVIEPLTPVRSAATVERTRAAFTDALLRSQRYVQLSDVHVTPRFTAIVKEIILAEITRVKDDALGSERQPRDIEVLDVYASTGRTKARQWFVLMTSAGDSRATTQLHCVVVERDSQHRYARGVDSRETCEAFSRQVDQVLYSQ